MSTSLEAPRMAVETEVVAKAARRRFTAAEKLRVLREAGSLGLGSHVLHLPEVRGLRAGVYLVRLTQGGRSLTTRAALIG